MSSFVQKVFAIKRRSRRKTEQMLKFLGPPFFSWGTTPTVLQQIVSAIYRPPFGKVWLSSVCWSPSAKPGNDAESRIYIGWVKIAVEFEDVCGPKFMLFWDDVGDPLWLSTHLTDRLYHVSFRRYRPLKLPKVHICRGGDTPDFGHAFLNCTYFRAGGQLCWVPFSELGD